MKTLRFLLPVLLFLTSCHIFKTSEVQQLVRSTRETGPNERLDGVHRVLSQRGIEHKIVQFRYDVASRPLVPPIDDPFFQLREAPRVWVLPRHAIRERTAVIYRDEADRRYPWWYVDTRANRPIWLPNDSLAEQVRYAMRRQIELLRVQEFDRAVDGMARDAGKAVAENEPAYWEARFAQLHGSAFDAASPVDRAKMQELQR